MPEYEHGDVLSYVPSRHHCREATAFVREDGRAVDTFWGPRGDGESHFLTEEELATATVRFNVNDFEALDRYSHSSRPTWETYRLDDRARISSQHGLREALFVRRGAKPDLATQIENARAHVAAAEEDVRSAQSRLEWRCEDLAKLLAAAEIGAAAPQDEARDA